MSIGQGLGLRQLGLGRLGLRGDDVQAGLPAGRSLQVALAAWRGSRVAVLDRRVRGGGVGLLQFGAQDGHECGLDHIDLLVLGVRVVQIHGRVQFVV